MKKTALRIIIVGMTATAMAWQTSNVLASEVTGTLSAKPPSENGASNINQTPQAQFVVLPQESSSQTSKADPEWDIPIAVKAIIIGLLIIEVIVLVVINALKKRRRRETVQIN